MEGDIITFFPFHIFIFGSSPSFQKLKVKCLCTVLSLPCSEPKTVIIFFLPLFQLFWPGQKKKKKNQTWGQEICDFISLGLSLAMRVLN